MVGEGYRRRRAGGREAGARGGPLGEGDASDVLIRGGEADRPDKREAVIVEGGAVSVIDPGDGVTAGVGTWDAMKSRIDARVVEVRGDGVDVAGGEGSKVDKRVDDEARRRGGKGRGVRVFFVMEGELFWFG